ncbi:type VI secretion system baseplate subunit TssG [Paraburkholderia sp. CNPSo 3076]|uniref:type VI secretion system baseplate subunit TssG n=1 Tax=Paraburkholderia sp. CNPSo 3076 TaxID=2940936 RepID=UPI0022543797|nr:type VI secretion system baseplate subunit TssG [Paraburkholderia sp. CNPSo 3076]MCX5541291.1 type VI secretion system baseplate subunit TssG [Paraburkholderia sp. CNPSo 3076]
MQPPQRRIDSGVIERLLEEPHRFGFFQAVRLLERWFVDKAGARQRDVLPQRIAFRNTLSLAFPASEIAGAVSYDAAGAPLADAGQRAAALDAGELERVDLTPAFFGLLGAQGALPLNYTEQIVAREQLRRDRAAREFFDVFSNRATALFYSAWKKYRLPLHYELDRDERYLPLLLALAGVANDASRESLQDGGGALFDEAIAGHAVAARHQPVSAAYLRQTLSDYFGVPVQVEQFVGKWYDVPHDQLSMLGQRNVMLGATALAGERVWQRDMRARLVIGPLSKADYEAFLPGAEHALALERMLTLLARVTLEYEVLLVLRREEVGPSRLGAGARLGWDAFLCTHEAERDRRDARYELHVIH